jgi:hypothetical protein
LRNSVGNWCPRRAIALNSPGANPTPSLRTASGNWEPARRAPKRTAKRPAVTGIPGPRQQLEPTGTAVARTGQLACRTRRGTPGRHSIKSPHAVLEWDSTTRGKRRPRLSAQMQPECLGQRSCSASRCGYFRRQRETEPMPSREREPRQQTLLLIGSGSGFVLLAPFSLP